MSANGKTRAVLELRVLSKRYGKRYVLRGVTLTAYAGRVHALVGVNGAGKTTLLRLATGLAFPSSGTVRLLGHDPSKVPYVKRALGAVIEAPAAFYPYLSGRDNLRWQGRLLALGKESAQRIEALLTRLELLPAANRPVKGYSLGMKQRLGLAAALLGEPKMLILDEPASSIDPLSVKTIYRVLHDAASKGCAVLLSTHQLEDVSYYCDEVSVLDGGVLATHVTLEAFRNSYFAHVSHVANAQNALHEVGITVREVRGSQLLIDVPARRQLGRVAYVLARARVGLFDLRPYRLDLAALLKRHRQERDATKLEATPPEATPKDISDVKQKNTQKDSA